MIDDSSALQRHVSVISIGWRSSQDITPSTLSIVPYTTTCVVRIFMNTLNKTACPESWSTYIFCRKFCLRPSITAHSIYIHVLGLLECGLLCDASIWPPSYGSFIRDHGYNRQRHLKFYHQRSRAHMEYTSVFIRSRRVRRCQQLRDWTVPPELFSFTDPYCIVVV